MLTIKLKLPATSADQSSHMLMMAVAFIAVVSIALVALISNPIERASGSQLDAEAAQELPTPTPTPTPTPDPITGLYRNTTEGFSLIIPAGWQGESFESNKVLVVEDDTVSPKVFYDVWLHRLSKPQDARDWLQAELAGYIEGLTPIPGQALIAADGTTATQLIIDYENSNGVAIRELWGAFGRGTQMILVRSFMTQSNYSNLANALSEVYSSFAFEVPAPFGASQSDSLFLLGGEIRTLDPALFRGSADSMVGYLFNGLVELDRDLEVSPSIARSWNVDDSGTVYTFHIDPAAKFHDGSSITASDVKYSFERAADPATESPTVRTYLGDIVGIDEMAAGDATNVSGLEVIDDLTLQITIDSAKAYFLQKLTYPTGYIVDKKNVESGEDWTKTPNGSGRFKLKVWVEDDLFILERFDGHHLEAPKLKHIVYRLFAGNPMSMYEAGEIDITGVGGFNIDRVTDPQNSLNQDLVTGVGMCTTYMYFNSGSPPFDDINVRRAFAQAIDMELILDVDLRGESNPAYSILPPGMAGHIPNRFSIEYDPEGALRLLQETAYYKAGLFSQPLASYSGDDAFHWMWQTNLGIDIVKVTLPDSDDWFKRRDAGEFGFGLGGWCADYPDPQNFLEVLFHSDSDENTIGYSNPRVDALLDQAAVESDHEKRIGLYSDAEQLILDDWVIIPITHVRFRVLVKPYVGNYVVTPIGVQNYHYLEITR